MPHSEKGSELQSGEKMGGRVGQTLPWEVSGLPAEDKAQGSFCSLVRMIELLPR